MSEYTKDYSSIDDTLLSPMQAARIWRSIAEGERHRFMNVLYTASEPLHDQVLALTAKSTDAGTPAPRSRAGGVSPAIRPALDERNV